MDSENQDDLAENDLARILKRFGSRFEGYGGPLVAGAIALIAVVLGVSVMRGQAAATKKEAWKKLASAQVAESFGSVADEYPETEVAAWARVNEGRLYMQEGIRQAFQNTAESKAALERAKTAYEAALASAVAPEEVKERALFGLATIAEAVSDGDTSAAIAAYERVIATYPEASSRKYAEKRIETLKSESAQEFYAWFSKQDLEPEAPSSPFDAALGGNDGQAPPSTPLQDAADSSEPAANPFAEFAPETEESSNNDGDGTGEGTVEMEKKPGESAPALPAPNASEPESAEPATETPDATPPAASEPAAE